MAITPSRHKTVMVLEYDEGLFDGKRMISRKRYTTLSGATDEGIHRAAIAIASLTTKDVLNVMAEKVDSLVEA